MVVLLSQSQRQAGNSCLALDCQGCGGMQEVHNGLFHTLLRPALGYMQLSQRDRKARPGPPTPHPLGCLAPGPADRARQGRRVLLWTPCSLRPLSQGLQVVGARLRDRAALGRTFPLTAQIADRTRTETRRAPAAASGMGVAERATMGSVQGRGQAGTAGQGGHDCSQPERVGLSGLCGAETPLGGPPRACSRLTGVHSGTLSLGCAWFAGTFLGCMSS